MSTLGYKNAEIFQKKDIAKLQLIEAINLFVSENFLCSLTLAGAAEELFAGLLRSLDKKPVIEDSINRIKEIRENIGITVMEERTKSEIIKEWNHAKNRIKHHDADESKTVYFNDCDEAYWMIKRAILNAESLGISIPNKLDFENWVIIKACL